MRVSLNHATLMWWKKAALFWLGFVITGLIFGVHLSPRPDEIAFVLLLPVPFVVVYAGASFLLALLRIGLITPLSRRILFHTDKRLRQRS